MKNHEVRLPKFYICPVCGNIIEMIRCSGMKPVCCGKEMQLLVAGSIDAAKEKHVPEITRDGCTVTVKVGIEPHPMADTHHISWIALVTNEGIMRKYLCTTQNACAKFHVGENECVIAAYAYCNLHGLWSAMCKKE